MKRIYFLIILISVNVFPARKEYRQENDIPLQGKILDFTVPKGPFEYKSEVIKYSTEDGAAIEATLLSPLIEGKRPGIVFVHMWARDRHTFWGLPEYLATYGYPSIYMDMRGHGNSRYPLKDIRITSKSIKESYKYNYLDILPAIERINKHKNVIPNKLFTISASLGCPIAVKSVFFNSDKFIGMLHLSPSMTYFDVSCKREIDVLREKPVLVVLEKTDLAYKNGIDFYKQFTLNRSIIELDRIGHGTDIIYNKIGFPAVVKNWLINIEESHNFFNNANKQIFMIPVD